MRNTLLYFLAILVIFPVTRNNNPNGRANMLSD